MSKWVYPFREGGESMRNLIGGKGAGSAEMTKAGMPVPPGFTITTAACLEYYANDKDFPAGLNAQVDVALAEVESAVGRRFGDPQNPLLVSVRSGARVSMPGMMDTVLNLGLNQATLEGLIAATGDARFGWDAYRRFIQGFGSIVLGVESHAFEDCIDKHKSRLGVDQDTELSASDWQAVADDFRRIIRDATNAEFPDDPRQQLDHAIRAVFDSWFGRRAVDYRRVHGLPDDWGTAVNVQTMVFGNMGEASGTGVAFTRNPNTGERELFGEYLLNAQGEDVVAGVRTPTPIATLETSMPEVFSQFENYATGLEQHYREMQDLEFTIESGKLYMLQTRAGKRSPAAAVKIAVDLVREGVIDKTTAVQRVEPEQVGAVLHPRVDPTHWDHPIATGLNASPGAAHGQVVFTADEAAELGRCRAPGDPGSSGDLARRLSRHGRLGGHSDRAGAARRATRPSWPASWAFRPVVGCDALRLDLDARQFTAHGVTVKAGDVITVDGTDGEVLTGALPLIPGSMTPELEELLRWADEIRRLSTWGNADTPEEAVLARELGAEGIGLCRTEHMFREGDRLPIVQEMILAETVEERQKALDRLLPIQREDFVGILRAMDGFPVVIRLLDPPLHEFLPGPRAACRRAGVSHRRRRRPRAPGAPGTHAAPRGTDPRGQPHARLAGLPSGHPAARGLRDAGAGDHRSGAGAERRRPPAAAQDHDSADQPRERVAEGGGAAACGRGRGGARQGRLGRLRVRHDDRGSSRLPDGRGASPRSRTSSASAPTTSRRRPTASRATTRRASSSLIMSSRGSCPRIRSRSWTPTASGHCCGWPWSRARAADPDIEMGICGEHGGDPDSIGICEQLGLDYVSASPFRIPVSRMAAAHARLADIERDR